MIKQLKNWVLQWIWIVSVIWIFGITYAAVTQVSTWETLTADIFNQSMVPTWAVMAFNGTTCPDGWNKADWSWDEKDTSWNLTTLDLRWEFIRGFDDGRGVDSGRVLGSTQSQNVQELQVVWDWSYEWWPLYVAENTSAWNNRNMVKANWKIDWKSYNGSYPASILKVWEGSDTRPRNVALLYCVKD